METHIIENIRKEHPALSSTVYLNTGTAGPLTYRVIRRMKEALEDQLSQGRINMEYYQKLETVKSEIRSLISSLISCKPSEISVTRSTSEGLNIIINGLQMKSGDEIITTNAEHLTVYAPAFNLKKIGVEIKLLDVLENYNTCLDQVKSLISPRTRLICLSHVIYCSGDTLPVKEICTYAREKNIPVLIDGAQSFGAFPVNVKEIDCDFFAAPGQKWICGPEGTGFLYVKEPAREIIDPLFTGYFSVKEFDLSKGVAFHEDGRRFESGTFQPADLAGFNEALKWVSEFNLNENFERSRSLCRLFRELASGNPKIDFINHDLSSSLISFKVKGVASDKVVQHLFERGITVRPVPITDAVRLSVGFFNTEEEIRKVVKEISDVRPY